MELGANINGIRHVILVPQNMQLFNCAISTVNSGSIHTQWATQCTKMSIVKC